MKKMFMKFDNDMIHSFESIIREENVEEEDFLVFMELADQGYAGCTDLGEIIIPCDVIDAYKKIDTEEFHERRERIRRACVYAELLTGLYGIVPGEVFLNVFNKNEENQMIWSEYISIFKDQVSEPDFFELAGTSLVHSDLIEVSRLVYLIRLGQPRPACGMSLVALSILWQ